jgi:hypothetical protein
MNVRVPLAHFLWPIQAEVRSPVGLGFVAILFTVLVAMLVSRIYGQKKRDEGTAGFWTRSIVPNAHPRERFLTEGESPRPTKRPQLPLRKRIWLSLAATGILVAIVLSEIFSGVSLWPEILIVVDVVIAVAVLRGGTRSRQ